MNASSDFTHEMKERVVELALSNLALHPREIWLKVSKEMNAHSVTIPDPGTGKLERLLGYGNPSLFGTLNGKIQIYIDGTFRIVPHPFYQCLIIMVFDVQTHVYVLVMYILMTVKSQFLYWHALHGLIAASRWNLESYTVTCDFERPLINAVREQS